MNSRQASGRHGAHQHPRTAPGLHRRAGRGHPRADRRQTVLLALSGGVDSSVVAALLIRAVGKQLICVHVNHGLMRKGETEQVIDVFQNQMDANLVYVDAVDRFLALLAGVAEPEAKRKIIGAEFIRVFEEEARKVGDEVSFLAQGTIYPDILESDGVKAHHNVGGLPDDLQFELVEPVSLLYKDEVRDVGPRARAARIHGGAPALPRPGTRRALPGRHHARPLGGAARGRRHPARGVRRGGPRGQGVAVLRRASPTSAPPASATASAPSSGPRSSAR